MTSKETYKNRNSLAWLRNAGSCSANRTVNDELDFETPLLRTACAKTLRAISWARAVHLDQLRCDEYLLRAANTPPARPASHSRGLVPLPA